MKNKTPAVSISIKYEELKSILTALSEYSSKAGSCDDDYTEQLVIDEENIRNVEEKYWKAVSSKMLKK